MCVPIQIQFAQLQAITYYLSMHQNILDNHHLLFHNLSLGNMGKTHEVIVGDVGVSLAEYCSEIKTAIQTVLNSQTD